MALRALCGAHQTTQEQRYQINICILIICTSYLHIVIPTCTFYFFPLFPVVGFAHVFSFYYKNISSYPISLQIHPIHEGVSAILIIANFFSKKNVVSIIYILYFHLLSAICSQFLFSIFFFFPN